MGELRLSTGLVVCGVLGVALAVARAPSVTAHRADGWQIAGAGRLTIAAPADRRADVVIAGASDTGADAPGALSLGFLAAIGEPALFAAAGSSALADDPRAGGSPVTRAPQRRGPPDSLASFSKVVIRPEGGSRLEGKGPAGADITLRLNGEAMQPVRVGPDGRWSADIGRRLEAGEHLISAATRRAGNGTISADEEIRVAIPRERATGEIVAVDRPEREAVDAADAEVRRRAEDLARAASERFTELSEPDKADARGRVGEPRQRVAQRATDAAQAKADKLDPNRDTTGSLGAPVEAVGQWLQRAEREYREVIVPGLASPRRVPPAETVSQSGEWLKLPDVKPVTDWLSRANQTYQREVVGPLTVPPTTPTPTPASAPDGPAVKQRTRLADEAIEREAARRAEAERRATERAGRLAEDERRRAEQRVKDTDDALRREGEQRAAEQRLKAAEEAARAAERARRQRVEAEIAEAERREKLKALAARLEAERQAAARREQAKAAEAAAEVARKVQEERRREAERLAAEAKRREAEAAERRLAEAERLAREQRQAAERKRLDAEAERVAAESRRAGEREFQFETLERKAERTEQVDDLMAQARRDTDRLAIEKAAAKAALERLLLEKAARSAEPPPPVRPPADLPQPPRALPDPRRAAPELRRELALVPLPDPAPQRPVRFVVEEGSGERGPVSGADEPIRAGARQRRDGREVPVDDDLPTPRVTADGFGASPHPEIGSVAAMGAVCRHRRAGRRIKLPGTYVVQRGDTLWTIASRHYRRGRHYVVIYRANRGKIDSPDTIYPCQRFWLPRLKKRR